MHQFKSRNLILSAAFAALGLCLASCANRQADQRSDGQEKGAAVTSGASPAVTSGEAASPAVPVPATAPADPGGASTTPATAPPGATAEPAQASSQGATAPAAPPNESPAAAPGAAASSAPAAATPAAASSTAQTVAPSSENVVLKTALGPIVIDLFEEEAPAHCENFKRLVRTGFYNGLAFHRVCQGFAQAGDPSTAGSVPGAAGSVPGAAGSVPGAAGRAEIEQTIPAEIVRPHVRGSVVAARRPDALNPRRDSHGSQFFIMRFPWSKFDGQYTVFGQVIEGMEFVDKIPQGKKGPDSDYQVDPAEAVKIITAELVPPSK